MNWKYTDFTCDVASRSVNGVVESTLASSLINEGVVIEPADTPQPPTTRQLLDNLDAENVLTPRNMRQVIMLMNEAFKQLSGGALDLATIPGVAKVYETEAKAEVIRTKL